MKVVLYSEYFFPVSGGVQTNIFELACGLSEWREDQSNSDRLEVTVITRTAEQTADDDSWPFRLVRRPGFGRLVQLLRKADVIHIAGPALVPMLVGLLLRKPVLIEHHGYQSMCPNGVLLLGTDRTVCPGHFMAANYEQCVRCNSGDMGWLGSLRALVLLFPRRWLCKHASSNIAITEHVARRIALPRTQRILYGIRDPGSSRLPQNGNAVEIGYVGRLVPEKGLPVLLKAARRLHDDGFPYRLTIVGGGPLRKQLEDESHELGIARHVTFAGDLGGTDLERAVRPLQIVVMPSMWEETAGLAAIEQMMRGGVVIASDIGGLSEVVGDAGLTFVPGDSDALYARLREVLESPSLALSMGDSARSRAAGLFGRDNMIRAHVSAYLEAMRR
jgi:glycogen synthase